MEIIIDGVTTEVGEGGDNLLHACLSAGLDLPYFCWHPALGSVGACRQCAVKQFHDESDSNGRIVMACMTAITPGARIALHDAEAVAFRASVIEWLMTNHPHDCPVCPEGGECHLQDMTVMSGHVRRRYRFTKRTFRNQDLGPFVQHEMNRCIACYRCVRFYRDYAGGRDLDVFASHRNVYFGRAADGVLESEFAGNLVEVCPTGVFTDKVLAKSFNRKWDLRGTPSLCVLCGLGCNIIPNERFGQLRRVLNRYNGAVNGYFLCDRGRFGAAFTNAPERLRTALVDQRPASSELALRVLAELRAGGKTIGIGSPRASLEANFALRSLVGPERFHLGLSAGEHDLLGLIRDILVNGPATAASIEQVEQADAILVLGEDVPNTAPRLALAMRQAARGRSFEIAERLKVPRWQDAGVRQAAPTQVSPIFVATPAATRLDDVARVIRLAPDDIARLGFAIAHRLDPAAPAVEGLADDVAALADSIAQALTSAQRPLVVAGTGCASRAVVEAAANIAWARRGQIAFAVPECNSLGLTLMGGGSLAEAFAAIAAGTADTMIVLENDLTRRAESAALDQVPHLVVLDHLRHATLAKAEIVFPAGTFAEADGTLVSNEGRAQRFFQLIVPDDEVKASWRWLNQAAGSPWSRLDDLTRAVAATLPALAAIGKAAPSADFRLHGAKIAREPPRFSGRTAIHADKSVHDPKPLEDSDSALSYTMEGESGPSLPPALVPFTWAPGWNSVQAVNKFQQETGGPLRGGNPGMRLIEPAPTAKPAYFTAIPASFAARAGEWLILPDHQVFGGEELSALAAAVAERVPPPSLSLNADDAAGLGIADGDAVVVLTGGTARDLVARVGPAPPAGVALLFDPAAAFALPAWGVVERWP